MIVYPIQTPIVVTWRFFEGEGSPIDLSGKTFTMLYKTGKGEIDCTSDTVVRDNAFTVTLPIVKQYFTGVYSFKVTVFNEDGSQLGIFYHQNAFMLVDRNVAKGSLSMQESKKSLTEEEQSVMLSTYTTISEQDRMAAEEQRKKNEIARQEAEAKREERVNEAIERLNESVDIKGITVPLNGNPMTICHNLDRFPSVSVSIWRDGELVETEFNVVYLDRNNISVEHDLSEQPEGYVYIK